MINFQQQFYRRIISTTLRSYSTSSLPLSHFVTKSTTRIYNNNHKISPSTSSFTSPPLITTYCNRYRYYSSGGGTSKENNNNNDSENNQQQNEQNQYVNALKVYITLALYTCGFIYIIKEYVMDFIICKGSSMEPSLLNLDIVLCDKRYSVNDRLKVGDIVILKSPTKTSGLVGKRIRFVEGDTIQYDTTYYGRKTITIPKGHIWVEGDNRITSFDSRMYGPIPKQLVRGKVFSKITLLNGFDICWADSIPYPPAQAIKLNDPDKSMI